MAFRAEATPEGGNNTPACHFLHPGMQQLLPELTSEPRLLEMLIERAAPSIEITCDVCEARMG